MTRILFTFTMFVAGAVLAFSQTVKDYNDLQTAMAAAQAKSIHPGDEAMTCGALEKEFVANVTDSTVQTLVAKQGAEAQKQQKEVAAKGQITSQAAMTMFSAFAPAGGWASLAAAEGQASTAQAQTAENLQKRMQQMNDLVSIMPKLMRAQRLLQLSMARNCTWLQVPDPAH
jgi:hypothetical protein